MHLTKPQKLIYDMEKFAGGSINVICGSMLLPGVKPETELIAAVNRVFQLNDALRIRINEEDGHASQCIIPYAEKNIEVLHFDSKAVLDFYAQNHATMPFEFYGNLCEIKVLILPEQYGLLVKFHHIVGDAWTIALIGTQFNAIMNGEEPSANSYCEYVENESVYLESQRFENDRTFFLEQFKKCDEVTYLSDTQSSSYSATRKTFVLNTEKTKQIKEYATQNKTSAYALFIAALAIYMSRTKMNVEKFYLGTAVLNRSGAREKRTMGMFVNAVPLLMELENDKSFAENLAIVGKSIFSAFRHQKFNYGDVLSAIREEHNFTEKLYDVMLSYQNATITGGDCETTWYHCGMQNESLQIHIDDRDNDGIFRIHYDYQTYKFTEQEIEMLHQHMVTLLYDAIENDSKKLYELNLLTSDEKWKLLYDFNNTSVEYPWDKCVHQLFEEQVVRSPNRNAVIACDKTITYSELNEQANRIAHSLIKSGVRIGDVVAFALPRRSYMVATILGILKAGAVYLPVDPDYPKERINYILKDSSAKAFITEHKIDELLKNESSTNPIVSMTGEALCYCIYTSGSTGQPKGALVRHRNMVNFCNVTPVNNLQDYISQRCNNVLACGSITFDISNFEIILSLLLGKSVVLANEAELANANLLGGLIQRNNIDCMHCTPTKLHTYLDNTDFAAAFSKIKCIMVGGESLTEDVCKAIHMCSHAAIFNGYGPTETTMGVSFGKII